MLQLTGAALAATVGSGYAVAENRSNSIQESEPIEFESSEELLLDATLLPENGWTQGQVEEGDVLDVSVTFQRNVSDDGSNFWVATSAAAGRETEAEAVGLYEELAADFVGQVGEGRTMDLDLASEAVIAGYDGFTGAIFRDVNCVGAVGFADCTSTVGCISHVARTESIARAKRQSWRGGAPAGGDAGGGGDGGSDSGGGDGGTGEFVDEVDGQVSLAYGETARVSNGVEVTVSEGTLYDQMGDQVPQNRDQFLVVPVGAANTSDEPQTIPDQTDSWEVLFADQQVANVFRIGALQAEGYTAFEGGDVQGGVRREGVLLFEVDSGIAASDVDVLWQDSLWVTGNLDGDADVRWSADG
ncbi:hypothetical protein HALDL1_05370 [Halobacterium sp. DL1]|jgi:hypothetical protein|nr:hypothetical protein HALDL1_05370 [Halobacterium sp. DL1]